MTTRVDEIADGIFRISTFVPEVAPPAGFAFNQFLIRAEEPLLFHTGHRRLFPAVYEAVERVIAPERLRWISFGHFEASLHPEMSATIRGLAPLVPHTLALMHGPAFVGDAVAALGALADDYDRRTAAWREQRALAA